MRVLSLLLAAALCCSAQGPRAEILWDTFGVPHIYAASPYSLMKAYGYAQMQSHGNLILELYGQARGRAAEYWGKSYRESDIEVRTFGIPGIASGWLLQQKPQFRGMLNAFVDGMNQYAKENPNRLDPVRMVALPVRPNDVLAHLVRVIHFSFVARNTAIQRQAQRWAAMPGSNGWAIGPARSASSHAMLLANPHLPWSGFYLWFEAQMSAPGFSFYGASLVGSCLPAVGFNDRLGWTHTVNTHDGADLYELTLTPEADGYYWNGGINLFDVSRQKLKVKQDDGFYKEEELLVRSSVHGPVIRLIHGKALALRVVGLDAPHMLEQYWQMAGAQDFATWEKAERLLQMPMFTTIYADADGHIYHLFGGRVPIRSQGDWKFWSGVIPGDTGETLWARTHAYEDLPKVLDPSSGWLQNANDPPWTTTFPVVLNPARFPPYMAPKGMSFRAQRSARMLAEDQRISFEEMIAYKHSTRLELADRILDDLIAAAHDHPDEAVRHAGDVLAVWDRSTDSQSQGALLFQEFYSGVALAGLLPKMFTTPWSEAEPRTTPRGFNREEMMPLFARAVMLTKERYGSLNAHWGDFYRLRLDGVDLPANGAGGELGAFRVTNYETDTDGKWKAVGGDSFVAAVEFSSPVRAQVLLTTGNSSQPGSPHRTDQLPFFSQKKLRPAWLTRAEVEAHLESRKSF